MLGWLLLFLAAALGLKFWHGRRAEKELREIKLKSIQRRLAEKEAPNQAPETGSEPKPRQ